MAITPQTWMSQVYDQIKDLKLSQLCLPGSHDSGMSVLSHSRVGSVDANTKTQNYDIFGQLSQGVRLLDFRPCIYESGTYLGHFSDADVIGWDGSTGQEWKSALAQLASFSADPENSKELIIVMVSHFYTEILSDETFQMRDMNASEVEALYNDVFTYLSDSAYVSDNSSINLNTLTVDDIISSGKNIVMLFDTSVSKAAPDPAAGIFELGDENTPGNLPIWNHYSDSDQFAAMNSGQLATYSDFSKAWYTSDDAPDILFLLSWTLTWLSPGSNSIEFMASQANAQLDETLATQDWTSLISKTHYPNIIYQDYVDDGQYHVVQTCLNLMGLTNQ